MREFLRFHPDAPWWVRVCWWTGLLALAFAGGLLISAVFS